MWKGAHSKCAVARHGRANRKLIYLAVVRAVVRHEQDEGKPLPLKYVDSFELDVAV